MNKRWLAIGAVGVVIVGGVVTARGGDKDTKKGEASTPFRLGKVQTEDLQVSVREVGVVDPVTKVDVKSSVSGRVVGLKVREGAVVHSGEVLAEVEPDVTQAQSLSDVQGSLTQSRLTFQNGDREYAQQKALFQAGLISEQQHRDAKVKRDLAEESFKSAQMRYQIVEDRGIPISGNAASQKARVTSPMNGVVIKKGVELGDTITSGVSSFNAGTVVFTVADLKSLIVRVNLNEVDIAKVNVGQSVRVTLDAYPQKSFTGKVRFVAPAAKLVDKIKVFEVEVQLDELGDAFRTGMSANVEILGEKRTKAVSVPLEALQRKEGQTVVYRLKKDLKPEAFKAAKEGLSGRGKFVWLSDHWQDYFERVDVKAGIATLERVEILSGLRADDQVALEDPTRKKVEKDDENN
ncbi:MAG: efflux RND transporter periplasmic adaptor subunit [Holophagaceae bacterium]|nr:efflux RND transporter periplasmic adaptor subunit [Holophagaceae bacterium]